MTSSGEDNSEQADLFDELAEELLRRCRRGERPDIEEFAGRFPELAVRIRKLFPTLLALERDTPTDASQSGPAAARSGSELPAVFDSFQVVRTIGQGGMGVVYEAVQSPLGRRVALKVLLAGSISRPAYRERFEREARVAARLHHTNIVPVFGSGEHDGRLFLVMQLIEGRNVADVLAELRGTPPPGHSQAMARLALQAAEALAYAHAQGVLHRDLKPGNLLLDGQGTLWIADFGLAKAEDVEDLTATGELVGTLRYLAPERFAGRCGPQSDLYALGATLYEMLALRPAFDAADQLTVVDQIKHGPQRLRRLAPEVPLDLETVVHKAMAAAPEHRYPSAQEMADDLRRFLADLPIKARRAGAPERLRRWARRNPVLAGLTSAVVVLLAVVGIVSTVMAIQLKVALGESERHLGEVRQSQDEMAELLWRSRIDQAHANRRSGKLGQRIESLRLLDAAARRRVTPELRDEVIACLALVDLEEVHRLPGALAGAPPTLACLPNLGRFVTVSRSGKVSLRRMRDGEEIAEVPSTLGRGLTVELISTPLGRLFLLSNEQSTSHEVWNVEGATPKLVGREDLPEPSVQEVLSDDGRMAVQLKDGGLQLRYLGSVRHTVPDRVVQALPARLPAQALSLHPSRPWLALGRGNTAVVLDLQTDQELMRLDCPSPVLGLTWDPLSHLVVGEIYNRLWLYDVAAQRVVRVLEDRRLGGISLACHPSLPLVVSKDWRPESGVWDTASGQLALAAPPKLELYPTWGSAPEALVAGTRGEDLFLFRVPPRVLREFAYHNATGPQFVGVPMPHPAGRWLVAGTADGLAVFDLDSLGGIPLAVPDQLPFGVVGFDSSGTLIRNSAHDLLYLAASDGPAGVQRLGPPTPQGLGFPVGEGFSFSLDGAAVAIGRYSKGAEIVHRGKPGSLRHLEHHDVRRTAVSPDGRWVATGSWTQSPTETAVKVWDAATGRPVADPPLAVCREVAFSPDGRWFGATDGSLLHLFSTETWKEERTFRATFRGLAFGPEGLLALPDGEAILLADAETGTEYCRLEAPGPTLPQPRYFSADGSLLMATDDTKVDLLVWDLRALRAELASRGLDWDRKPFPPPAPRKGPDRLEFDLGDQQRTTPPATAPGK
jgi:WD40 repeat protein/predicted Ser/Thr protein kinase